MKYNQGDKVGNWIIEEQLNSGGTSEVYLARHETLTKKVRVIKTGDREKLELEAKILQQLQHPNIVRIDDADYESSPPYIALEAGEETLGDKLKDGRLPWREAIAYTKQILRGLTHAHSKGIIHRDIKPDNIILVNGTAKIADWDIAKTEYKNRRSMKKIPQSKKLLHSLIEHTKGTAHPKIAGTIPYMSPEQQDAKGTTEKTDIYSVGIILYQMLTGERPVGLDPAKKLDCQAWIGKILNIALEPEPERRYTSKEFLEEIINREPKKISRVGKIIQIIGYAVIAIAGFGIAGHLNCRTAERIRNNRNRPLTPTATIPRTEQENAPQEQNFEENIPEREATIPRTEQENAPQEQNFEENIPEREYTPATEQSRQEYTELQRQISELNRLIRERERIYAEEREQLQTQLEELERRDDVNEEECEQLRLRLEQRTRRTEQLQNERSRLQAELERTPRAGDKHLDIVLQYTARTIQTAERVQGYLNAVQRRQERELTKIELAMALERISSNNYINNGQLEIAVRQLERAGHRTTHVRNAELSWVIPFNYIIRQNTIGQFSQQFYAEYRRRPDFETTTDLDLCRFAERIDRNGDSIITEDELQ